MPGPPPIPRAAIAAALAGLLAACASPGAPASIALDPPVAAVAPGETVAFTAAVAGSDEPVVWEVAEPGGGTVDETGSYTAPLAEGTFHVHAWVGTAETRRTAEIRVRRSAVADGPPAARPPRAGRAGARGRHALSG
jgi:hypothetical protein